MATSRRTMFGDLHNSFYDDPFFGMPQDRHGLRRMDDLVFDPFGALGSDPFLAITDGTDRHGGSERRESDRRGSDRRVAERRRDVAEYDRGRASCDLAEYDRPARDVMRSDDMFVNPFGFMNSMMSNMNRMMEGMHRQWENVDRGDLNGDGHFYSQSSVMSFSKAGDGQPKIYQATKSTRQAPGGIRETHKALRDSEAGIEKMSIGRHIKDRGHVMTRERKTTTGHVDENQDFINIDESEGPAFESEWKQRTRQGRDPLSGRQHAGQDDRNRSVHAIEHSENTAPRESRHAKKK